MQRNFDLIRLILRDIEAAPPGQRATQFTYSNFDEPTIQEHIVLLIENGLVEGTIHSPISGMKIGSPTRLTWTGHDFLDVSKDESIWSRAKETVLLPTASISFNLLLEWLKFQAKEKLGIPQ